MIIRLLAQTILMLAVMGGVMGLAAGGRLWLEGWLYLAELGVGALAIGLWLARHDPALLASRLSSPVQADQQPWDRIFIGAAGVLFIGWTALIALDVRLGGPRAPPWAEAAGAAMIAAGFVLVWRTFRVNSFAAPQVRIQADRGQRVITEGPYRVVRHPMYAGALFYLVGAPLMLGSWWGLAPVPLFVVGLAARTVGEERMLRRELAGYDAYARRVRFRFVPGVW